MMVVVALVVGYLLLSSLAALVLISACVAGKRYDSLFTRSSDLEQQNSLALVREELKVREALKAETNAEAKVANERLNQFMPQLTHHVTE
jgi:hypothetical protein